MDEWTTPHALAVLVSDRVYVYPATADGLAGGGQPVLGGAGDTANAAPDIACNDDGICLTVWTAHNGSEHTFRWRRVLPTAQVTDTEQSLVAPAGATTGPCAVASGESGFLAVWAEGDALKAASINQYGTVSSPTLTLDSGLVGGVDVTYAYDRYHVVWSREGDLYAAEVYGTQVTTYTVSAEDGVAEDQPAIAYDDMGQRSLIVYRRATGGSSPYVLARTFAGGHIGDAVTLAQEGGLDAAMTSAVSADPMNGGWTVSLSGTLTDVNPDTVEVLLQSKDSLAGFGWQPATVGGSGDSWSIEYILTNFDNQQNRLPNPTGVYTVSLRAADLPGNRTPEAIYPPTVNLDNTAPDTALTFPISDTAALTDTGSVAYGVAGVEIAFVDSEDDPPVITWRDAVLTTPGAITSTWFYTLPADMEGFYEIYVRGTDVVGNRNDYQSTWPVWQGLVDTQDPYVDALADYGVMGSVPPLTAGSLITYTDVTCQARDLTLDISRFSGCPCDPSVWQITTYDQVSPWYRDIFSDTTHIYQVDAQCLLLGKFVTPPTVHAYDAAGRHSQTVLSETVSIRLLDSVIFTPTDGIVLTTTNSFAVEGHAVAAPWQVGVITVTVNGAVWQTHIYGSGLIQDWSDTFDLATYNPPGDGRYRFLSVVREANNPDGNREQTVLHPVTVTVDSLPPSTPTFTTTVFTTVHRADVWPVFLTGIVTDIVGLDRVETDRDGEG